MRVEIDRNLSLLSTTSLSLTLKTSNTSNETFPLIRIAWKYSKDFYLVVNKD